MFSIKMPIVSLTEHNTNCRRAEIENNDLIKVLNYKRNL